MFKAIGILFISAFAIAANAADSAAIGGPPGLSPAYANEGWGCAGVGTQAISTAGMPLSCQSGVWKKHSGNDMLSVTSPTASCSTQIPVFNGNFVTASCPAGYQVTGGGYQLAWWGPFNDYSSNAPDYSAPSGNGWGVIAGAKAANSCFVAFAVCIK